VTKTDPNIVDDNMRVAHIKLALSRGSIKRRKAPNWSTLGSVERKSSATREEALCPRSSRLPIFGSSRNTQTRSVGLQMGPVEGKRLHYISEVTRNTVEAHDAWRASDRARELQVRFGPMIAEAKQSIARVLIGGPACRALGFTVPTMGDIAK
jgi:hypothetical protein